MVALSALVSTGPAVIRLEIVQIEVWIQSHVIRLCSSMFHKLWRRRNGAHLTLHPVVPSRPGNGGLWHLEIRLALSWPHLWLSLLRNGLIEQISDRAELVWVVMGLMLKGAFVLLLWIPHIIHILKGEW